MTVKPTALSLTPPPMFDVLKKFQRATMSEIRCCLPATVTGVDSAMGTVDAQITVKYTKATGEYADYPVLSALPAIVLQGGGVAAKFPVQVGDQCLVFFADRAMDAWKGSGTAQPLPNNRMHDLSDGFALVGVNSFNKVLDLFLEDSEGGIATKNAKVVIDRTTETITLENAAAQIVLNKTSGKIHLANQTKNLFTVLSNLNTALTTLLTALGTPPLVVPATGVLQAAPAAAIAAAIVSITAVQAEVTGLLE